MDVWRRDSKHHEQRPNGGCCSALLAILEKEPLWQEGKESRGVGAFVVNWGESLD